LRLTGPEFVDSDAISNAKKRVIVNQHIWSFLLLSYIVLPPVSNKQLQALDCLSLGSGERYLRADTSINCASFKYLYFRGWVVFFICLYQMIPIVWMVILYKKRRSLNPETSNGDETLALFIRDNNPALSSMKFLFIDYKCNKWWFEIADMYRRITFVGLLPLLSNNSITRASFGCILSILSVVYFSENKPYRVEFTNMIAHVAQVCISSFFCFSITIPPFMSRFCPT
jgi:hypothetical protein